MSNTLEEIKKLKDAESYTVPESDYGLAEVWKKNGWFFLFEIPQYGGEPMYIGSYCEGREDEIVKTIEEWS